MLPRFNPPTILIIERQSITRFDMQSQLVKNGYQVVCNENPEAVNTLIKKQRPDAIIMDSGFVRMMRDSDDLKQNLLVWKLNHKTDFPSGDTWLLNNRLGIIATFSKPFDMELLVKSLNLLFPIMGRKVLSL